MKKTNKNQFTEQEVYDINMFIDWMYTDLVYVLQVDIHNNILVDDNKKPILMDNKYIYYPSTLMYRDNNMIPLNQSNKSSSTKYSNLEKFVSDLTNAYKAAGITNEDLLKLLIGQDAFESNWGKNPVGSYNFGNIIVTPSFKGEYEEGLDNGNKRKFRSYNSLLEYVKDKLRILNNTYQITNSDSIDSAISKLMGNNKGKYKYAEAQDYADKLRAMVRSVNKKFK